MVMWVLMRIYEERDDKCILMLLNFGCLFAVLLDN